jgi:hypothetical protein
MRGDGTPKSAKSLWLVPCGTRAPRGAPITAVAAPGPAFVRSVAQANCADRAVSQLLAGTPSGPGGSSAAARVPRCDEARRRRTPSRLTTPHETPLTGRGEQMIRAVLGAVIMRGQLTQSRHPGESRGPGATSSAQAALDTGFRRYDGVRCLLGERQPASPLVGEGFPPGARSATIGGKGEG